MSNIAHHLRDNGLFLRRRDLISAGFTSAELRSALGDHSIFRVRQGWFTVPAAPEDAIRAVRIGGRLTGLSALSSYGVWTPRSLRLDVAVPTDARALRTPNDMRKRLVDTDAAGCTISWTDDSATRRPPHTWRVPIHEALLRVLHTGDLLTVVTCVDSVLNLHRRRVLRFGEDAVDRVFAAGPKRVHRWRELVDGRADSGGETEFRLRCRARGIPFRPQSSVPGVGRVDGRIGPTTFVEIDGAATHDTPEGFAEDRRRDLAMAVGGRRPLRFTYRQIHDEWRWCEAGMCAALALDPGFSTRERSYWRARSLVPTQNDGDFARFCPFPAENELFRRNLRRFE
ncbi:hypothetical protein [Compostimonas suwonensis]|uniref:Uncharacterized protein n=1 Tax=Compostimonas suwonensis TaxID=1048394 RepID=A0A2M9BUX4_9MICO|nr:hypothetical protein [Compostimonas suwonensis]PJJ61720.1 hypothetical protein CLV54_2670 [Compostimonas suwonensis]